MGAFLPDWPLSLVVAMVDISLGDEMSIFPLFSMCSWLVAGRWVLGFPLSHVRKCLTLPVALQHLNYQNMLIIITIVIVPIIRSFVCNTKRPVKQSMKWQVSSNFQIYPGKTDEPSLPPI